MGDTFMLWLLCSIFNQGMMYTLMAAQEGNIMAQCSLGFMHLYGTGGLDQDFDYAYCK